MLDKIQEQLSNKLEGLFDTLISDRESFYTNNPDKKPSIDNVDKIINYYANANAMVTGSLSLVPGIWAMATAVPEIVMLVRNQSAMIYEIGMAHGREKTMNKEMILSILASTLGVGAIGVVNAQASKMVMKQVSSRQFKNMIPALSGKISQQMLQTAIGRFIPIIGSAALAAWSRYSTKRIGEKARDFFSGETEEMTEEATPSPIVNTDLEKLKIRAYINLVRRHNTPISTEETNFIKSMIEAAGLDELEQTTLMESLKHHENFDLDFTSLKNSEKDARGFLLGLVSLAKRDTNINTSEKSYLREVGSMLGYSEEDMKEMMEA